MVNKRFRVERLTQQIQREVDDILLKRVRDPRVAGVTITGVDLTKDLQQATVYYTILSETASDGEKVQMGLDKVTGLVRRELGSRLSVFRTPEIKFVRDPSIKYGKRIDELLNKLHQKDELHS